MRIAITIDSLDPDRGGKEQWTYQFVQQLVRRGHEVHVVAQGFSAKTLGLPIHVHPLGKIGGRMRLAAAIERRVRTLATDIVHDMGSGWYCDVFESHDGVRLAQWNRKLRALPRPLSALKPLLHGLLPRYRELARLERRQVAAGDKIVLALSKAVARDYQTHYRLTPDAIRLIYNGVDTRRFSPHARLRHRAEIRDRLRISADEMLVLFVGNDFVRKGLATAIRAVRSLADAGAAVRLAVVGAQRRGASAEQLAPGVAGGHVVHVGRVLDPTPYYAAADVSVLPTLYDPCSLSILEAMASGLPCVTTVCNGAAELMTDGVEGYVLADPTDHALLATRLRTLLDRDLRKGMGKAARRLALRHTIEHNCDEIVGLYEEILARRLPSTIRLSPECTDRSPRNDTALPTLPDRRAA